MTPRITPDDVRAAIATIEAFAQRLLPSHDVGINFNVDPGEWPLRPLICPRCLYNFEEHRMPNYRLLAWLPGVTEPEAVVIPEPTEDTFSVVFAEPATSPGGVVHLQYSGYPRPESLVAVYVQAGTIGESDRTPENLIADQYSKGVELIDATVEAGAISVIAQPTPAPGVYDVAVFGVYPD